MSATFSKDYGDFSVPITDLGGDNGKLTPAASKLMEGDLVAMAWGNHTPRTEGLVVRDLQSIDEAFSAHPFKGHSKAAMVGSSCCCSCCPCCCTASAVVDTVADYEQAAA